MAGDPGVREAIVAADKARAREAAAALDAAADAEQTAVSLATLDALFAFSGVDESLQEVYADLHGAQVPGWHTPKGPGSPGSPGGARRRRRGRANPDRVCDMIATQAADLPPAAHEPLLRRLLGEWARRKAQCAREERNGEAELQRAAPRYEGHHDAYVRHIQDTAAV